MKVTIIIPNFNHSRFLIQRIETVLTQSYQHFELIILDDNSTDDSKAIIEQYKGYEKVSHVVYNQTNSGNTFLQWKKGIELAKGEYIWIAESDDYCESNFLQNTTQLLDANPDASLVYCTTHRVNEKGEFLDDLSFWYDDLSVSKWRNNYKIDGKEEISTALCLRNTIPNASAVLFRKEKCNPDWEEIIRYKLSGDWLFWIKLAQVGSVLYTTTTTNYFRTHTGTVRNQTEKGDTILNEQKRILKYLIDHKLISRRMLKSLLKKNTVDRSSVLSRVLSKLRRVLK